MKLILIHRFDSSTSIAFRSCGQVAFDVRRWSRRWICCHGWSRSSSHRSRGSSNHDWTSTRVKDTVCCTSISTTWLRRDGTSLVVINVYCPRVDQDKPERLTYKLNFYSALEQRARCFLQRGWSVFFLGELRRQKHCFLSVEWLSSVISMYRTSLSIAVIPVTIWM